jgi:hypothetical protein
MIEGVNVIPVEEMGSGVNLEENSYTVLYEQSAHNRKEYTYWTKATVKSRTTVEIHSSCGLQTNTLE